MAIIVAITAIAACFSCRVTNMAQAQAIADTRRHSTVYHKKDHRVNTLIRREKKSDLISLYNIECQMLFRVEAAHIQFDMLNNHRPFVLFHGKAEGVYLPASTGLLFPNMCDQLDFRPDYPVEAAVSYELSDVEIATLAGNGLFNYDWSCQGRVIGALLEIPCAVDYHAIANTPITYLEIQDRLNLRTSTRKTGYKTLIAAFLPYNAQKHNLEKYPKLMNAEEYDRDNASIRKRSLYDSKAVGFMPEFADPDHDTVSFVEAAQTRIHKALEEQMKKSNVLETKAEKTSKSIVEAVDTIKSQADKAKSRAIAEAGGDEARVDTAVLDARLNDMKVKMAYQGAQDIPIEQAKIKADPLVEMKPADRNDTSMSTPVTKTTLTPDKLIEENRKIAQANAVIESEAESAAKAESAKAAIESGDAAEIIESADNKIHGNVMNAEAVASDVKDKVMTRKEKLAMRRQQAAITQQRMIAAAEEEERKGLTERKPDRELLDARKLSEQAKETKAAVANMPKTDKFEDDILADLDLGDN